MITRRLLGLAAGAIAIPGVGAQAARPVEQLGPSARLPSFKAQNADGTPITIPEPGKAALVNLWATWCPPCRTEMPLLEQVAEIYGDQLVFQPVNHKERADTAQRLIASAGWKIPLLLDPQGAGAAAWAVKIFPTTVGFDAQGRARWRVTGDYDWTSTEAARLIEGLWR